MPHIEKMPDSTDRVPVTRAASLEPNTTAFAIAAVSVAEGTCVPFASAMAEDFTGYTRHVCLSPAKRIIPLKQLDKSNIGG